MLMNGSVGAPANSASLSASLQPIALLDQQGSMQVTEIHGQYYVANKMANNVYMASLTSAATIPANGSGVASKFALLNPSGSNKVLELVDLDVTTVATATASGLMLVYQTSAAAALGTLTAGTIQAGVAGNTVASVCTFYTAATHTGTPTVWFHLGGQQTTSAIQQTPWHQDFKGKAIVPPGYVIDVVATATGPTTGTFISLSWAEWPL